MKAETKDLLRRKHRPWRAVFVLYALTLTTATHWPSLDVGGDAFEAPDKILHMTAFAAALVLLWRTRWVPRVWQAGAIVLAWAVIDELSQAFPVLNRTLSGQDLAASELGVIVTLAWFAALAPVGGPANRLRLAWQAFVIDDLFSRPAMWIATALAGACGALVIGAATWAILMRMDLEATLSTSMLVPASVMLGGFAGGVAAGLAAVAAGLQRRSGILAPRRPCFACGHSCRDAEVGDDGRGRCPACGAVFHVAQWAPPMVVPLAVAVRGVGPAVLSGAAVIVAAIAVFGLALALSVHVAAMAWALRFWEGLLPDMRLCIDLGLIAVAVAVAVRVYRARQAPLYDRQHLRCRCCDHDLSGTEVRQGVALCGECGTPFARITDG